MSTPKDNQIIIFDTSYGKEKEYFLENFSLLITAGIPINVALDSLKNQIKSPRLGKVVKKIQTQIDQGSPLWKALELTDLLPPPTIALVRIGEDSGNLPKNISLIIEQRQKDREFKSQLKSAMMYPLIILCVTVGTLVGVTWFVLPRITKLFDGLKVELPLITKIILRIGDIMNEHGTVIVLSFFGFIAITSILFLKFKLLKLWGERIILSTPAINTVIQQIELARFGFILSSLLDSGIPVSIALDSLSRATSFHSYQKFYDQLKQNIIDGHNFKDSFQKIKHSPHYIPIPYQQMIFVGEQTGKLSKTLSQVSRIFEAKAQLAHKTLSTILEPLLVVFMALGVGTVSLAIILPVYSLINGINNEVNSASAPGTTTVTITSPTPTTTIPTISPIETKRIEILPTEVGYVNVRAQPTTTSPILQQVHAGEIFPYTQEADEWIEIQLNKTQTGWVTVQFTRKLDG